MPSRRSGASPGRLRAAHLGLGALTACLLALAPTSAQEPPASRTEARAQLERSCVEDGAEPDACACSTGVLDEHLSDRELAAVALMFADPLGAVDPGAAIATLLGAGYTLAEITATMERIVTLEGEAERECAPPDAVAEPG